MPELTVLMHGHHSGTLFSFGVSYPLRANEIDTYKPPGERALRRELMRDVTGFLPRNEAWDALVEAWDAYEAARAGIEALPGLAGERATDTYPQTWDSFCKAARVYEKSFDTEAFHREHCHPNCPWDGRTIFAKGCSVKVLAEGGGAAWKRTMNDVEIWTLMEEGHDDHA